MDIQIIQVPYDSGYQNRRQGRGPVHFIQHNAAGRIGDQGHKVAVACIEPDTFFPMEVAMAFELNRLLAEQVSNAIGSGQFPVVLAGNCNTCLGTIGGIGSQKLGVLYFDAHGEFNTPETTPSGWLDGMPLAMATGRCWKSLLDTIPGFVPIQDEHLILVGARDLDEPEERLLSESSVNLIRSEQFNAGDLKQAIKDTLLGIKNRVDGLYVHIDMDAIEVQNGCANHYGVHGGLKVDLIKEMIEFAKIHFMLRACTIASYDPDYDEEDTLVEAGLQLLETITGNKQTIANI